MRDQNNTHEDRILLITNDERRMIVRALGLLETALNIEDGVCSDDYKESVRELAHIFCEENWMPQYHINSYKVRSLDEVLDKEKAPPTEKQISYIKGICEVLGKVYNEPKTKGEATVWLNHFVPFYKRKCEENELEWEANNSEIMNNYGDWSD